MSCILTTQSFQSFQYTPSETTLWLSQKVCFWPFVATPNGSFTDNHAWEMRLSSISCQTCLDLYTCMFDWINMYCNDVVCSEIAEKSHIIWTVQNLSFSCILQPFFRAGNWKPMQNKFSPHNPSVCLFQKILSAMVELHNSCNKAVKCTNTSCDLWPREWVYS